MPDDDDDDGSGRDSPNDADLKTLDLGLTLKSDLKNMVKEKTGLYNRLRSIQYDNDFVARICQQVYPHFAVAPNLRCGAWYVKPAWPRVVQHPVYFKSTDGHYNNWDFNLRRANLHLLAAIQDHHGIVIVDSTRKGKRFPDALSKTVPIWCCVLNRAVAKIFGIQTFDVDLHTSPRTVSRSEHSQIEERLDIWAERILQSAFTLPRLSKPLRPIWVSPDTEVPPQLSLATDFHPVVCLSASEMVEDGVERRHGYCYVQGSGDDHESWSQGLSPSTYWRHLDQIVSASHDAIDAVVANIVEQDSPTSGNASWS
ncbi:hypothetical protein FRB99_007548 [Tulasnella sp. 403]|nr:hypothetical protein FRB99_007548 [Tulasnella sp. 403]